MIGISANFCVMFHLTGGYVARYRSPKFAYGKLHISLERFLKVK